MPASQSSARVAGSICGLLAAIASVLAPAPASALTNYTWTGAVPQGAGASNWSNATNWGGSAPSGSVGTLTFPALTGNPACTSLPTTAACYESQNDLSGITTTGLVIDDGYHYFLSGNGISVGAGGLMASTSASDGSGFAAITAPLTLTAPQAWSIDGGTTGAAHVNILGNVTGQADALTVSLPNFAQLGLLRGSDAEVGTVNVSGNGFVSLGGGAPGQPPASLNGTDANPVAFSGDTFLVANGDGNSVGPLTLTTSSLQVGNPYPNGSGTSGAGSLAVSGGMTFQSGSKYSTSVNQPGTTAGTSYSQLSATGTVALGSGTADLNLLDGINEASGECETPNDGDVLTLITTTGSLTGTFDGVPDGTTVPLVCVASGPEPSAVIHYTAHSVTATIGSGSGPPPSRLPTATALEVSNLGPAVGENVTFTATVTTEPGEPVPPDAVMFLDNEAAIPACEAQPVTKGATASTATCTISYPAAGSHKIEAFYTGSGFYEESFSAAQTVTVHGTGSSGGGGSTGGGSTPTPQPTMPTPHPRKPLKCHKGFRRVVKHGKARCVKRKRHKHLRVG